MKEQLHVEAFCAAVYLCANSSLRKFSFAAQDFRALHVDSRARGLIRARKKSSALE